MYNRPPFAQYLSWNDNEPLFSWCYGATMGGLIECFVWIGLQLDLNDNDHPASRERRPPVSEMAVLLFCFVFVFVFFWVISRMKMLLFLLLAFWFEKKKPTMRMEYLKINKWTISVPVWSRMKSLWATSESLTSCAPRWSTPGWATRSARTCSTPNCRPWSTTPYNSRAWSRCAVFTLVSNSKVSSFFFFSLYISLGSLIYNHRAAHWWADFAASFCWGVSESIDYIRDWQKRKLCGKRYVTKCRRGETASCHITAEPVHYVKSRTLLLIRAGAARVPANLSDDGAAFIHHTRAASEHNERQKKKKIKGGNKQLSHHSATDSGGRIKKKHCKAFCLLSYYYSFPFLDCVFFSPRAPSIVSPSQQQPQQQTRNKRRKKNGTGTIWPSTATVGVFTDTRLAAILLIIHKVNRLEWRRKEKRMNHSHSDDDPRLSFCAFWVLLPSMDEHSSAFGPSDIIARRVNLRVGGRPRAQGVDLLQ